MCLRRASIPSSPQISSAPRNTMSQAPPWFETPQHALTARPPYGSTGIELGVIADVASYITGTPGHIAASCPTSGDKIIFNYRLSRARSIVENAIVKLVARLRVYQRRVHLSLGHTRNMIQATIVLHNYLQKTSASAALEVWANLQGKPQEDGDGMQNISVCHVEDELQTRKGRSCRI